MDLTSIASGIIAAQTGNLQLQVAAAILKSDDEAGQSSVQSLLGAAQQSFSSLANVSEGIGANLDITA